MIKKEDCYRILELSPRANTAEIETRYNMLLKRYRGQNDPETIKRIEEITLAYDILTGRYVEPEPVDPRMEDIVFGKTRREWSNLWHYGRMPLLGILIAAFFIGSLIYTIATNKPADFQVVVAGQYFIADNAEERLQTYIRESIDGVETVEYQLIPLSFADQQPTETGNQPTGVTGGLDPESEYAFVMKMMAIIAGETIEVFICEKSVFDQYAPQGIFYELDALYARLQDLPEEVLDGIKPLRRVLFDVYDETENAEALWPDEAAMDNDLSLPIYGLDVSELQLFEGLGFYGKNHVLTVGFKADDPEQAVDFLEFWIRDYERMHAERQAYEDQIRNEQTS